MIKFLFSFEKLFFFEGDDTRMVEGGGARPRDKSERGVKPRYNETKTDRSRPVKERGRGSRGSRSGEQGDSWDYVYKVWGAGMGSCPHPIQCLIFLISSSLKKIINM